MKTPVVLAHGMLGLAQAFIQGLRLADYFNGIPYWLEENGCKVIIPQVEGIGSIKTRASNLKSQILQATDQPVHIIAHSQGGLDSRHMISHLDMANQVRSLTTIGTPHRGSPVADWAISKSQQIGVFKMLEWSSMDTQAFLDLRTTECATFNEKTPDDEGIKYLSVAGEPKREHTLRALRMCHDIVFEAEGPNDGLVSSQSARWGEEAIIWRADHAQQIGWFNDPSFDWRDGWGKILNHIGK
jgi:triacylglycerol lipase